MLDGLERKLVALVADAVRDRAHLTAIEAAGDAPAPAAGRATVRVGLDDVRPEGGFDRERVSFGGTNNAPTSRRVLKVHFGATVQFELRPTATTDTARTDGRTLLLGDLSRVGHALDEHDVQNGRAFEVAAGDPGFMVHSFALAEGELDPETPNGDPAELLRARLDYDGTASIWPPEPPAGEGVTHAVDVNIEPVPLSISVDDAVVRAGGSTTIRIAGVRGGRLTTIDPRNRDPLALAVTVTSDLPPANRGRVNGGTAGLETGVRILRVTGDSTAVPYAAPTGDLGSTRVEFVAVHLATPDGGTGIFLDSIPIKLTS